MVSRREFVLGTLGCALGLGSGGCTAVNPAPMVEADPQGTIPIQGLLASPGDQVKVRLPRAPELVLVWKTARDFGAASIVCTHRGSEVHLNLSESTLDCPSHGSRFDPHGKAVHGPAQKPLTPYRVTVEGDRLRIEPA
jgi:Rieske Fe-S protein